MKTFNRNRDGRLVPAFTPLGQGLLILPIIAAGVFAVGFLDLKLTAALLWGGLFAVWTVLVQGLVWLARRGQANEAPGGVPDPGRQDGLDRDR